jgi:hypothetical protein
MVDQIRCLNQSPGLQDGLVKAQLMAHNRKEYMQDAVFKLLLDSRSELFPDTEACLQTLLAAAGLELQVRYESRSYRSREPATRWVSGTECGGRGC